MSSVAHPLLGRTTSGNVTTAFSFPQDDHLPNPSSSRCQNQLSLPSHPKQDFNGRDQNNKYEDLEKTETEFRVQVFIVHTLICIACFFAGRFEFSVVVLWVFISHFNSWYNYRTRQTRQRIAWWCQREIGNERVCILLRVLFLSS